MLRKTYEADHVTADWTGEHIWQQNKSVGQGDRFGQDRGVKAEADVLIAMGLKVTEAHQCLSGEHLQQGDEVVSISEVLVQVGDVSLGLWREDKEAKCW